MVHLFCIYRSDEIDRKPGLWLRDLASSLSPIHKYTGTDIDASSFPNAPPQNFSYHVQDTGKTWPTAWSGAFDFVHQRLGLATLPNPEETIKNLAALVKPGGWIEFVELSNREAADAGPMSKLALRLMQDIFGAMGSNYFANIAKIPQWLKESAFEHVEEKIFEVKFGAQQLDRNLADKSVVSDTLMLRQLCEVAKCELCNVSSFWVLTTLPAFPPGIISLSREQLIQLAIEGPKETERVGKVWYMHAVWGKKMT
jgi:SAM-dependent methyltransferase